MFEFNAEDACPKCGGTVGHRINCPDGIAFSSEAPRALNRERKMECTKACWGEALRGGDHAYCECPCHVGSLPATPPSRERRAVNVVRDEGGRGAWALFYLERLVNSGVLDRAKQRGEHVPNFEKIKTLVERKLK